MQYVIKTSNSLNIKKNVFSKKGGEYNRHQSKEIWEAIYLNHTRIKRVIS